MSAKFCDLMSAQILDTLFIVCSVQTENKAGAYPRVEHMKAAKIRLDWKGLSGGAHERCTLDQVGKAYQGQTPCCTWKGANIRLGWKGLPGTNNVAYYEKSLIMAVCLVQIEIKPGAHPKVEHLKGASLGQALALLAKIRIGQKRLPGTKITGLLSPFVRYKEHKVL